MYPHIHWISIAVYRGPHPQALEDGPDRGFRNVGQYKPDAGDTPKNW
jgi:hypothetical protein